MNFIKLISTACLLFIASAVFAQDKIELKNGDTVDVRITEAADDYVKYFHFDDPNKVEVKMNRSLIRKISYEYGREEQEIQPGVDESYFVDDNKNNIKLNFTSIASAVSVLTYERGISPYQSVEVDAKFHGVGINNDAEKSGFGIAGAYKFKLGRLFKKNQYRPNHLMHGSYLRPGLGYNSVNFDMPSQSIGDYVSTSYVHGGLDFGKQWVINNGLSLDIFTGLHYYSSGGFESDPTLPDGFFFDEAISDGDMAGSSSTALRYGVRIGYTF